MPRIKSIIFEPIGGLIQRKPYLTSVAKAFFLIAINQEKALPPKPEQVIRDENKTFFTSGGFQDLAIIFSAAKGVFIFRPKRRQLKKILEGKYYGITKYNDYWIIVRSNNYTPSNISGDKSRRQSDVCAVKIVDNCIIDYKILLWGIPGEIHQVDIFNDFFYLPHTGYNQILYLPVKHLLNSRIPKTILNCSSKALNIFSPSHLNSIYYDKLSKTIYLVAHNSTAHTGRFSDVLLLENHSTNPKVIKTKAHSAHNVVSIDGEIFYCDSNNSKLIQGEKCIFETDKLLRGLSITDSHIFVGGSEIDFTGKRRSTSDSCIYILSWKGGLISQFDFPSIGGINEIRQLNNFDYAMSASF